MHKNLVFTRRNKGLAEKSVPVKEKTAKMEENGFHQKENPFPLAEMKDFVEKYFSTRWKKKLLVGISENWRKNGFY